MRWIIGDVHGMLRPLEAMLRAIRDRDGQPHFFFAGDYCDRGPDTRGVIDLLLDLTADGTATCVRGNHDDILDLCLNRHSFASGEELGGEAGPASILDAVDLFWREGLRETLASYGVDISARPARGTESKLLDWIASEVEKVPKAHRKFIRQLPGVAEQEDFFVVHATWPPDYLDPDDGMAAMLEGDPYLRYEAIWGRYTASQLRSDKAWTRRGYFGHTPTEIYANHLDLLPDIAGVIDGKQLTLIDTACFSPGGRLSAVCHDTGDFLQVHHSGEVLE